jgi:hypothetical protein
MLLRRPAICIVNIILDKYLQQQQPLGHGLGQLHEPVMQLNSTALT